MIKLKLLIILLLPTYFFGSSFKFPNETFEYAKIFYFNLGEIKTKPDYYIYSEEDGFAKSIMGSGKLSSQELTVSIQKLFSKTHEGLINGLSGCFIPRHGIVYFDKNDQPVASLSICFECEAIRMWTKSTGKIKSKNLKTIAGAATQIIQLKALLQNEKIIVSDNPSDYISLMTESVTMRVDTLDAKIVQPTFQQALNWFSEAPTISQKTKISNGGERYNFGELLLDNETNFLFLNDRTDAILGEAIIKSAKVKLPNGIMIGQTTAQVLSTLKNYIGPTQPKELTIEDASHKIVYTFENQKLVSIAINK